MADKLSWIFELQDKITGPAKAAGASLTSLTDRFRAAKESSFDMGSALKGLATGAAAYGIYKVATGFAEAAISALSFRENSLAAFESILKSKGAAKAVFDEARHLADVTPFSTEQVVGTYRSLVGAGFAQKNLSTLFAGIGDIASLGGNEAARSAMLENLTRGITQVKGKGILQMEELTGQILEAAGGTIDRKMVFKHIAEQLKIGVGEVEAAIQGRRVSGDQGIFAIFKAIEDRGGAIGNIMEAQGKTFSGLWSTLKSAPGAFFNALPVDTKGFVALKKVLSNVVEVFSPASESGKRFVDILERGSQQLAKWLEPLTGAGGLGTVGEWMDKIVDFAEDAITGFKAFGSEVWDTIKPLRDLLGVTESSGDKGQVFIVFMKEAGLLTGKLIVGLGVLAVAMEKVIGLASKLTESNLGRYLFTDMGSKRWDSLNEFRAKDEAENRAAMALQAGVSNGAQVMTPNRSAFAPTVNVAIQMSVDAKGHPDAEGLSRKVKDLLSTDHSLTNVFEKLAQGNGAY